MEEAKDKKNKKFDTFLNISIAVLFGLVITLFILKTFFFGYYEVNGPSMNPTLHDGEKIIASLVKDSTELEREDVVVIDTGSMFLVKRLIGLPGDTISIKEGKVYVNGEVRENEPNTELFYEGKSVELELTLKDDEYFVLGDNRENSIDSREYGLFSKEDIKASFEREMVKN